MELQIFIEFQVSAFNTMKQFYHCGIFILLDPFHTEVLQKQPLKCRSFLRWWQFSGGSELLFFKVP